MYEGHAGMSVRPMVRDDLSLVRSIIDAVALFPSEMLDDMASPFLDSGEEVWLVAEDETVEAVGICYAAPERMTEGTWNALLIAVHPQRQRSGIGRRLMDQLEASLETRNVRLLLVETSGLPAFDGTRSFYHKLGYREEARIRDFYQADEDKIVFRKALRLPL